MSNTLNRENALLSTFLWIDYMFVDKSQVFKINPKIFTSSFRRAVADKINQEIDGEQMFGGLHLTLEDHCIGSDKEFEWLNIESQTSLPLSVAKRIHEKLEVEYKERIIRGMK